MIKTPTVLLIEDDADVAALVKEALNDDGIEVTLATDGGRGLKLAASLLPDLILLDRNLPTIKGHEICRQLKAQPETQAIPVIFLTGEISEADVVLGFEVGAEDYAKKPFSSKELAARVRATLRRAKKNKGGAPETQALRHGPLILDRARFETKRETQSIALTQSEFQILWLLLEQPGVVNSRERLIRGMSEGVHVIDRTIDVHIASIRKKLGPVGKSIVTVRGVGYKWVD